MNGVIKNISKQNVAFIESEIRKENKINERKRINWN